MMTMVQKPHPMDLKGIQRTYKFGNGLHVSAIKTLFSYGGKNNLWEIAVMDGEDGGFVTRNFFDVDDDVIGHLDENELFEHLKIVSEASWKK